MCGSGEEPPERSPRRFPQPPAAPRLPPPHPQLSSSRMEERPPSSPRVAWEESGAPRERKHPPEPYEVTEVQPLRAGE